jgi:dienelactone hydrolase
MAGNAKEWVLNRVGEGRAVVGGSWQDPAYIYGELGSAPPMVASLTLGFRCARTVRPAADDQGAGPILLDQRTPRYRGVDAATFQTFLAHYGYDRRPANPRVAEVLETADWTRERVWLDGVTGDSILVYLYLPRQGVPPLQTLVFAPGVNVFFGDRVSEAAERILGGVIRAGRAVLAPVLRGMTERETTEGLPASPSVRFRDLMVRHATEIRLAMDWVETRPEIRGGPLGYVGLSWGAGSRLPLAAVDDRFRAVVLLGGGIDERMQPTLPEASNINFAPYIRAPKLLLNGRHDEEHPWFTRALPLWNLLREPKKLVLVPGAGHIPPLEVLVPTMNQWLDTTLGPVRREARAPRGR